MPSDRGGFLIRFDEDQRASFLSEVRGIEDGFSDALSRADWPLKRWEVCGLMFEPDVITHWALARKGRGVVTGKVRIAFSRVTATSVSLDDLENRVDSRLKVHVVRASSGSGGRVPPATWTSMKGVLRSTNPDSLKALEYLESLRDRSDLPVDIPDLEIISQQRDATGIVLDAFDRTRKLRKKILQGWLPPTERPLKSFLEGVEGVRTIEGQVIARDATGFPNADAVSYTVVGGVFSVGDRAIEVFNVDRTSIESSLGVDLLYHNQEFDAWTLVQYKLMEQGANQDESETVYRPDSDGSFSSELKRMRDFRTRVADNWHPGDGPAHYRLCGDGFYFKFCPRIQLELMSPSLLPGMYVSRLLMESLLTGDTLKGPRGGKAITSGNMQRHINNTMFADLVRDAWIGTRGVSSAEIGKIVREAIVAGRSVVLGGARTEGAAADLDATRSALGL